MPPELSRRFPVDRAWDGARVIVEASPDEREAVRGRLGLEGVRQLTCKFDLRRAGGDMLQAHGVLRARVVQLCVVSLEPFEAEITEDFTVRFVPAAAMSEELELEGEDEIPYEGADIDLGEAATEQLALALEPFPRKPGVVLAGHEAGPAGGAFAALAKLRPAN